MLPPNPQRGSLTPCFLKSSTARSAASLFLNLDPVSEVTQDQPRKERYNSMADLPDTSLSLIGGCRVAVDICELTESRERFHDGCPNFVVVTCVVALDAFDQNTRREELAWHTSLIRAGTRPNLIALTVRAIGTRVILRASRQSTPGDQGTY